MASGRCFIDYLFTMQCACAGSTAGGIKCDRILLSFKAIKAQILQLQHPNAIIRVKMNGMIQDNAVVNQAILFIWFYLMIVAVGVLLISFFGIDLTTSFGITIGSMGNVGPGLGKWALWIIIIYYLLASNLYVRS